MSTDANTDPNAEKETPDPRLTGEAPAESEGTPMTSGFKGTDIAGEPVEDEPEPAVIETPLDYEPGTYIGEPPEDEAQDDPEGKLPLVLIWHGKQLPKFCKLRQSYYGTITDQMPGGLFGVYTFLWLCHHSPKAIQGQVHGRGGLAGAVVAITTWAEKHCPDEEVGEANELFKQAMRKIMKAVPDGGEGDDSGK